MRFAGIGLLILGILFALGAAVVESAGAVLPTLLTGGFMFLAGAVFIGSVGIQDAIKQRG